MEPVDTSEEDEPRLKYQRLGAEAEELLVDEKAVCLCVSDKLLALGLSKGSVHLLDYEGNEVCMPCMYCSSLGKIRKNRRLQHQARMQVKRFRSHGKQVNCICFDKNAEFVASCSSDGTVAVGSCFSTCCC